MKFGNIVQVETSRYLTKIATLRRKADCELVLAAKHTATAGGNQARLDARTGFETSQRSLKGGEAGRAHGRMLGAGDEDPLIIPMAAVPVFTLFLIPRELWKRGCLLSSGCISNLWLAFNVAKLGF